MRAGVLANERVITFLNENFINIWVSNVELERTPNKQAFMAKRCKNKSKTFNRTHALAQVIMKGWKKGSPVDCFVISHEFEPMGSVDYNEFPENLGEFDDDTEAYLFFLKASMEGKRPGLGDLILTREQPSQEVVDTFRTPIVAHQDYTVVFINTTAFEDGGTLTIDIKVGRDNGIGIFHLLDGDKKLPTEKVPEGIDPEKWNSQESDEYEKALDALTKIRGIFPGEVGRITYQFNQGQRFKLCATGDQWNEIGDINAFHAKIQVESLEDRPTGLSKDTSQAPLSEVSVALNDEKCEQEVMLNFRAPGKGYQDYTIVNIDTTAYEDGGTLNIKLQVGNADASGSFDLFDSDTELPTEGIPEEALVSAWVIKPGKSGKMSYRFEQGTVFKLGATGDWSSKKGNINAFSAKISVEATD